MESNSSDEDSKKISSDPMVDESNIEAIRGMGSTGSDAGNKVHCKKNPIIVILRGTSLPDDEIKSSLSQLFSTCGKITEVYIPTCVRIESLNKYAFVYFTGEDAEEKADAEKKALLLNGTDVGGCKIMVKVMPARGYPELYVSMAEFRETQLITPRTVLVFVQELDTSRDEPTTIDLLRKCFAECGEVELVLVYHSRAIVHIEGLRHQVVEKASALNGKVVDGWKVVVEPFVKQDEIVFDGVYC